jgi:hypothetical protein
LAPTFSTTDRESFEHGIKILAYGPAGSGKTHLCGTLPSPIILSAEKGLLTLRKKSIPVIIIEKLQDVWDAKTWIEQNARKQGILSVAVDSISEIVEQCLSVHRKKSNDGRKAYGDMAIEAIDLIKAFRDLEGFHVCVTAKQTLTKDPLTGVDKATPSTPGRQVGPDLPYLFDEVFNTFTDKAPDGSTYHALRTHASFNAEAKDRSGVLDEIEYPDLAHIINKIMTT